MTAVFVSDRDEQPEPPLRAAIRDAHRRDETAADEEILAAAQIPADARDRIAATARRLVVAVRRERLGPGAKRGGLDAFLQEYALSSPEGVALMCLAEALLRIPDSDTVDRLIRDKIAAADWRHHLGHSGSLFVNASTWALMLTGRLLRPDHGDVDLGSALRRLVARSGEPVWRQAVTAAMRILGDQFVMGRTIEEALARAREAEREGYRHSFDMLGEAARHRPMRPATAPPTRTRSPRSAGPRPAARSRRRRGSRSSCRRCTRATR